MLFDGLTDAEKVLAEKAGAVKLHPKGSTVVRESDAGSSMFLVRSGVVEVRKNLDPERYKQLKTLAADDFFGEMSFLTGAPRSADVVALHDSEILELRRDAFDRLVEKNPAVGAKVYRNIAQELANRLRRNNDELRSAILWALEEMIT